MSSKFITGLVGIGNLGSAMAKKLVSQGPLLLSDTFLGKARQMAKILGVDFEPLPGLFQKSDIILLAIPPEEVCPLVQKLGSLLKKGAILVNLATGLDTCEIRNHLGREDVEVVGLKPISQAYALSRGYPTMFVTSCQEEVLREKLKTLMKPIGEVVVGDELAVGKINAEATRSGLKLFLSLQEKFRSMGIPQSWIEVAIKTVAVGTILDYPTEGPNPYIEARLKELSFEKGQEASL